MAGAVRVEGLRETVRALNKLDRAVTQGINRELKKVAEPVVEDGRGLISRYAGARVSSIRARARTGTVFVQQGARKVTGNRPDFGRLQQAKLEKALDQNQEKVREGLEDFLDRITSEF